MGIKLADQMLADHLKKHGKYPEKVSFVIWGDETMRHEGVLESQIFHLLGTKPVWDARGKVVDVEVIPRASWDGRAWTSSLPLPPKACSTMSRCSWTRPCRR
jgi:cobalamin biosynthesis Mg chelatase CobN